MTIRLDDVRIFAAVADAGGFREASRGSGTSASRASGAVRRLESAVGVRLLHRTTRSVTPTEAGLSLLERLRPALAEVDAALDAVGGSRERPAGTIRLNVPTIAAQVVLPKLLPPFLASHPEVRIEVRAEDDLVDVLAAGCDAGIRYRETLEKDMIAVPIGAREQRYALGASPAYLERCGRPRHPRDLLEHACLRLRFASGPLVPWEFERDGEVLEVQPQGPLTVNLGGADLVIGAATEGSGVLYLFEDRLRPYFASGALKPILRRWWLRFSGPYLYFPSRRHMPAAFRAFVDYVRGARL